MEKIRTSAHLCDDTTSAYAVTQRRKLLEAGLPKAILWNNDPKKKVPTDIFIVATLERAYNDFVVEKLAAFFGNERILSALLKYKDRVSDRLIERITTHLQDLKSTV